MYRIENKAEAIKEIQKYLGGIDKGIRIVPNGIFDTNTKAAVKNFQLLHGIEDTGIVDYSTFTALCKEYKRLISNNNTRQNTVGHIKFPITKGDFGNSISDINNTIQEFLLRYSYCIRIQNKKLFSAESVAAVRKIREILVLEESDEIDEEMYRRMKNDDYLSQHFADK